jgi:ribonuclease HI
VKITLIADASFCPNTGAGGYGWWAASERGKRGGGGQMRDRVCNSSAAEMIAVVNGLYMAIQCKIVQEGDHILLQTDCMSALDVFLRKRSKKLNKSETAAFTKLYELKKQHRLTYSFRHVKGHSNVKEARYITNNLCDERARKGMRLARRRLGGIDGDDK